MKNLILMLYLISLSQNLKSQDCEDLKFIENQATFHYWKEQNIKNQKLYFSDSSLMTEYVNLPRNRKLRIDYYKEGLKRFTAEIRQVHSIDSSYFKDTETGQFILKIDSGFKDVFHGKYVEYYGPEYSYSEKVKSFGQFTNGIMTGVWQTERANRYIVVGNFNESGKLEGEYNEYYITRGSRRGKIHWKGQYGIELITSVVFDIDRNGFIEREVESSVRIGSWTKYSIAGTLIQTVNYHWGL